MLKFVSKDNKIRYVLEDSDTEPKEVNEDVERKLNELGIYLTEEEAGLNRIAKTSGISQDDLKHIRGN